MDDDIPPNDLSREEVVIFVAEGIVCERLGVSIDEAVVALADMAVTRDLSLLEMARAVVADEVDPGSYTRARGDPGGRMTDPNTG
jgi:hypothetical protein